MSRNHQVRVVLFLIGTIICLYAAWGIYFETGYDGLTAELALLKYVLRIDRSGGPLQEHISSYLEDRASSILVAMLLLALAAVLACRAWSVLRRTLSLRGTG